MAVENAIPADTAKITSDDTLSETDGTPAVGVPEPGNFNLPWFNEYGRPFFERQGLKLRAGPLHFRMSLYAGLEYNDNIFGTATNQVADSIFHISPNFLFGIGDFQSKNEDFLRLSYHPTLDYYQTQTQQNRVNQNLEIEAQGTFSRYSTTLDLTYVSDNAPDATQNGGGSYSILNFDWDNRYFLTAKTFARAQVGAVIQQNENGNDYQTFSISPQVGYTFSPKTTLSFGPFAGIAYVGEGSSQTFQGLSLNINYSNLRKLTVNGMFGVQARQFNGFDTTGTKNFMTPVFDLEFIYAASANMNIQLGLVRDVQLSDFQQGLVYTNSGVNLQISRKIFEKLSFAVGISYQLLEYQGDAPLGRTDEYISFMPTLNYSFWRDAFSISVFYRGQRRTSDVEQFQYNVNAYGFGITYNF